MIKLKVGYPSVVEEKEILQRRRERKQDDIPLLQVTAPEQIVDMRAVVESIYFHSDLESYIAELVHATRVDRRVAVGASPRASLAFLKLGRAFAALQCRDYVIPDDVKRFAFPVLGHRLVLQPEHWMSQRARSDVIAEVLNKVPVPVIQ
jgi:MoxR-like ATPase